MGTPQELKHLQNALSAMAKQHNSARQVKEEIQKEAEEKQNQIKEIPLPPPPNVPKSE